MKAAPLYDPSFFSYRSASGRTYQSPCFGRWTAGQVGYESWPGHENYAILLRHCPRTMRAALTEKVLP